MGRLFGTDGVRGEFGRDLTPELARDLGRAAVSVLRRRVPGSLTLLVGRDTRASGEILERALVEGALAEGADVRLAGVIPTPAVAFLTTRLGAGAGVVISASHNPPEDNGIKFFGPSGYKVPDEVEDEIEAELGRDAADDTRRGSVETLEGAERAYIEHVVEAAEARLDGMRIVVDCANGAASEVGPAVLRSLGAEVDAIFCGPDGTNINVGCGALHPEVVAKAVRERGTDAGVCLDGDADRALFADADGNVIDGDQVLTACALAVREAGGLNGNVVVTTVMANVGLAVALEHAGIEVIRTGVGDRYVLEEMLVRGAVLGGEQSGHVIFADRATTGDGLLTAVRFLSTARARGQTPGAFAAAMERFPQALRSVRVTRKDQLDEAASVWDAVRAAEAELGTSGRVLVRASGTEPIVRVMVEAGEEAVAVEHADALAELVRVELG
jgi:phosphoglucosamine mutase